MTAVNQGFSNVENRLGRQPAPSETARKASHGGVFWDEHDVKTSSALAQLNR